jgi:hypothetical protein
MSREKKIERARSLKLQGWTYSEIGVELGIATVTAQKYCLLNCLDAVYFKPLHRIKDERQRQIIGFLKSHYRMNLASVRRFLASLNLKWSAKSVAKLYGEA